MEVNSVKYRALKRCTSDLRLVTQSDLINISGELFAADLITQDSFNRLGIDAVPKQTLCVEFN